MYLCFRFGEPPEHCHRLFFNGVGQPRVSDYLVDVMQVAVSLHFATLDMKLASRDSAPFRLLHAKGRTSTKRRQSIVQGAKISADIKQRTDGHVAADSGKGIEVTDSHLSSSGN